MIDFPASPTLNQQFTAAGVTWIWDGAKWAASGLSVPYLPIAGGTLTGPLNLAADPVAALQPVTKQYFDARPMLGDNRIINGDMRIDQRNNGASGSANNAYTIDRWRYNASQTGKGSWGRTAGFAGFPYCLFFQSSSAYASLAGDVFSLNQPVEADAVSDFQWGSANAQPVTLSFWVSSLLTGTFSGSVCNFAGTRSYPFTFSIPTSNVATKIVLTIPGDTAGTWVMSGNAGALYVRFDLGTGSSARGTAGAWVTGNITGVTGTVSVVGTSGALFSVTGVKLEIGSVATPFRWQSLAKCWNDCLRYYYQPTGLLLSNGYQAAAGQTHNSVYFPTAMRVAPTVTPINITYNNASALSINNVDIGFYRTTLTITAAGYGYVNYNCSYSAEL